MSKTLTLPVKHVSHTAWLVAAFRAQESTRPDSYFKDPLASKLLGTLEDEYLARFSKEARTESWILTVRTHQIDQTILKAIKNGVDTVLNLGAGLDTRPYRLDLPKSFNWFEADFPEVINYKNATLKEDTPICHLTRLPADLSNAATRKKLLATVDQKAKSTLVLTEGLLGYLSETNIIELISDLMKMKTWKYWLMDVFNQSFLSTHEQIFHLPEGEKDDVQLGFIPEDTAAFLKKYGLDLDEFTSFGEGALKWNRLPKGVSKEAFQSQRAFFESGICLFHPNRR